MGLFSRSYYKEGPGVDPNEPQKRSFFRFFDIFKRKLGHFARANLIYSAVCIPTFIVIFFLMSYMIGSVVSTFFAEIEGVAVVTLVMACIFAAFYISVMGAGPVTAGLTYVMRNFVKEEHAWLWSDFKDNIKKNFKQGIIVFVVDIVVALLIFFASYLYVQIGGVIGAFRYVLYVLGGIYAIMHFYIYQIMITFDLSIKDIYKNAMIFTLIRLPLNLLFLIILFIIHVGIPVFLILQFGVNVQYTMIALVVITVLELVIAQTFSSFMINFGVYPTIKKFMMDNEEEEK